MVCPFGVHVFLCFSGASRRGAMTGRYLATGGGEIVTIVTFWTRLMRKQWTVAFVMLLLFGSTLPLATAASPNPSCPTAGRTLWVVYLDSNPKSAAVGTTVVTTVGVGYFERNYPQATLSPETVSFRWVGSAGEKIVENAPVVSKGVGSEHMGKLYAYEQTVGDDFPTGTVTIYVLACSCSDGQGNYGPERDMSSDNSMHEGDSSMVEIGATMQQPAAQDVLAAYGVPIMIGILIIFAVLLLVLRRRKKKT